MIKPQAFGVLGNTHKNRRNYSTAGIGRTFIFQIQILFYLWGVDSIRGKLKAPLIIIENQMSKSDHLSR